MKRIMIMIMALVLVNIAVAVPCHSFENQYFGNVVVHVVDDNGADLEDATVAPEWKRSWTGWNDFFPKEKDSDSDGMTTKWNYVRSGSLVQVNYVELEGYTCSSGIDTRITTNAGNNVLTSICTEDVSDVPEFGTIGAILVAFGAAGYALKKRK